MMPPRRSGRSPCRTPGTNWTQLACTSRTMVEMACRSWSSADSSTRSSWSDALRSRRRWQDLPDRIPADLRGPSRSRSKRQPHAAAAYAMPLRVADVVAVLDDRGIERAHFIGISWGGRLCFGIGEHAPERIRSLVTIGQQPYAIDPDGPLARVVWEALAASREQGIGALVEAFEAIAGRYPDEVREHVPRVRRCCDARRVALRDGGGSGERRPRCVERPLSDLRRRGRPRLLRPGGAGGGGDPQRGVPSDRRHRPSGCGHGCDRSRAAPRSFGNDCARRTENACERGDSNPHALSGTGS